MSNLYANDTVLYSHFFFKIGEPDHQTKIKVVSWFDNILAYTPTLLDT